MRAGRLGAVAIAAAFAMGCSSNGTTAGRTTASTTAPSRQQTTSATTAPNTRGRYAVSFHTETFVDSSRSTPANRSVPSSPRRSLTTLIISPADGPAGGDVQSDAPVAQRGRPFPLIVFGHGFTGFGGAYQSLLESWAEAGYVVAAPNFPLSNLNAPGGPNVTDYVHQPADVSFVISTLLAESGRAGGPLSGVIDPHRVAVAGHSLGAITVVGLFNSCCRDPRIDAAIVLAGAELPFPGSNFEGGPAVPILFVHGTSDRIVKYTFGQKAYGDAPPPKFFLTLDGADHVTPYLGNPNSRPTSAAVANVTLDFLDRFLRGDSAAAARMVQDGNVAGVASLRSS